MSQTFHLDQAIRIGILTISDTRTVATDTGGKLVKELVRTEGMEVSDYRLVKDDQEAIQAVLIDWLGSDGVDVLITTGGTGIAARDVTLEAVEPLFEKELPGFGELFRFLSFTEDVGSKALLSRASAGVAQGKALFVLPGSRGAVKLAMKRLILPEIRHITFELKKHLHPLE